MLEALRDCYYALCQGFSPLLAGLIVCLYASRILGGFQEITGQAGLEPKNQGIV